MNGYRLPNYFDINLWIKQLNSLPITPEEIIELLNSTTRVIISKKLDFNQYIERIIGLINKGFDNKEIINELKK